LLSTASLALAQTGPAAQGPMLVERVTTSFLAAPDFKITEVDRKTSALVGAYAGWLIDRTLFVGGGGYWLANGNRNREMAYGGLVVGAFVRADRRVAFGVKGLVGVGFVSSWLRLPLLTHHLDHNLTLAGTRIQFQQHDLLPRTEEQRLVREGYGQRRTDERRAYVARSVVVAPAEVMAVVGPAWHDRFEQPIQVGDRARLEFDGRHRRGRADDEDDGEARGAA
jgi:hypothetical protein